MDDAVMCVLCLENVKAVATHKMACGCAARICHACARRTAAWALKKTWGDTDDHRGQLARLMITERPASIKLDETCPVCYKPTYWLAPVAIPRLSEILYILWPLIRFFLNFFVSPLLTGLVLVYAQSWSCSSDEFWCGVGTKSVLCQAAVRSAHQILLQHVPTNLRKYFWAEVIFSSFLQYLLESRLPYRWWLCPLTPLVGIFSALACFVTVALWRTLILWFYEEVVAVSMMKTD